MAVIDLAIDMGSSYTTIFKKGSGIVLKEPTCICLQKVAKGNVIKEIGQKAKKMQGRTGAGSAVVFPVCEGIIKNVDLCIDILKYFLEKVIPYSVIKQKIRAVVTIPCGLNEDEINDYEKVMYGAGIGRIHLVPSILAAAIGEDLKVSQPRGRLIVNIGGGKTEVAVLALNSIVNGVMLSIGGNLMDTSIIECIQDLFNMEISQSTAEKIKCEVASLFSTDRSSLQFSGSDISSNRPITEVVSAGQISIAVSTFYDDIIKTIEAVINACKPDIIADITDLGVTLTGGCSNITGAENYFKKALNLPVTVSENASNSVALGAGKLISDEYFLNSVLKEN